MRKSPRRSAALIGSVLLLVRPDTTYATELEHWSCAVDGSPIRWTIAEDRMFSAKGPGVWNIVTNNDTLLVAYLNQVSNKSLSSMVYIIDKAHHSGIIWSNVGAVGVAQMGGEDLRAMNSTGPCLPSN